MKTSLKISIGGIIAALSIVLMFLTSIVPFGTYAFPMISGILLCVIVIEINYPWAFATWFAVSVLSLLILTDKEAALYYAAFFGFYPIIKSFIERLRFKALQYLIKYVIFNVCMIAAFFIGIFLLSVPKESFYLFGFYLPWVFLIAGNLFFILYDICVTRLVTIYLIKWHKKIRKNTKL
ncbi:MAG: hypothetical protein IJH32_02350 [Ruminococcus sp.]|nr:hypothetical protein [Ruminococcus sp.]